MHIQSTSALDHHLHGFLLGETDGCTAGQRQKLPYALPVSGFGKRWYLQAVRVESVVRDLCLTENRDLQAIASQRRLYQIRPLLDTSTPPPHRFSSSVVRQRRM